MALAWLLNSLSDIVMAEALGGVAIYALRTRAEVRELKHVLGYAHEPAAPPSPNPGVRNTRSYRAWRP